MRVMTSIEPTRRQWLQQSAAVAALMAGAGQLACHAQTIHRAAFEATSLVEVLKVMGFGMAQASAEVMVEAPDFQEDGAVVPLGVSTTLSGVRHLLLVIENNPTALVAAFTLTDRVVPDISIRAKMAKSSDVHAVAILGDGKVFFDRKSVTITVGGCGQDSVDASPPPPPSRGTKATLIRAQSSGASAKVRLRMTHAMETGLRKDSIGQSIPAWHITEVTVGHNRKTVMTAQWGTAVSKNPSLQFTCQGAQVGDKIGVTWIDNWGVTRADEAVVS